MAHICFITGQLFVGLLMSASAGYMFYALRYSVFGDSHADPMHDLWWRFQNTRIGKWIVTRVSRVIGDF